jgi:predicted nucleic acid-binding protein
VIVVSDASPLIGLAVTGHLEFLKHLYEQVFIPEGVYQELTGGDVELPGASEVRTLEWIISRPVQNEVVVHALEGEVDHGEAAAIALAVELQADLILIDEQRARRAATRLGLNVVGVLGFWSRRSTRP